jgi:hypothetical protein
LKPASNQIPEQQALDQSDASIVTDSHGHDNRMSQNNKMAKIPQKQHKIVVFFAVSLL